jgi:hypothetical protein
MCDVTRSRQPLTRVRLHCINMCIILLISMRRLSLTSTPQWTFFRHSYLNTNARLEETKITVVIGRHSHGVDPHCTVFFFSYILNHHGNLDEWSIFHEKKASISLAEDTKHSGCVDVKISRKQARVNILKPESIVSATTSKRLAALRCNRLRTMLLPKSVQVIWMHLGQLPRKHNQPSRHLRHNRFLRHSIVYLRNC